MIQKRTDEAATSLPVFGPEQSGNLGGAALNLPGIVYRVFKERSRKPLLSEDRVRAITGFGPEDVPTGLHPPLLPWIVPDEQDIAYFALADCLKLCAPFELQYQITCRNGETRLLHDRGNPVLGPDGRPFAVDGIIIDVSGQDDTVLRFKQKEEALRTIIHSLRHGVVVIYAKTHQIVGANPVAQKTIGMIEKELFGVRCFDVMCSAKEGQCPVTDLRQQISDVEATIVSRRGESHPVSKTETRVSWGDEEYIVVAFRDLSNEKEAERQRDELEKRLFRAEKLESLGVLAGGVAHDLNNILGPLVALPDLMERSLSEAAAGSKTALQSAKDDLTWIRSSATRAAAVVSDLVTMGRRSNLSRSPVDIVQLLRDYLNSPELRELQILYPGVTIFEKFDRDDLVVEGSADHIRRAVSNIVINAFQSIQGEGCITISAAPTHLKYPTTGYEIIEPGDYILISICDDGIGIADDAIDRVFDPFYTTKPPSQRSGSGLGLSVVRGIVKDHDGFIHLTSEPGKGAELNLYLPRFVLKKPATRAAARLDIVGGTEKILAVDDEPAQLMLLSNGLSKFGYTVETARNGTEAVDLFRKARRAGSASPYDLVLLDMVMEEHFDGLATLKQILDMYPRQKVVIVSGHAPERRGEAAQELGAGWLTKPFTFSRLDAAIRSYFDPE